MHPTMMYLLGQAHAKELSADLSRDTRRRDTTTLRRFRGLRRPGREHV